MTSPLRIATRDSRLARWQADYVAQLLRPVIAPRRVELVLVRTTGDVESAAPLTEIGGIGVFTKEVQLAVLDDRADAAVHSLKDLPTAETPGLTLAAVPVRGLAGDALIAPRFTGLDSLPLGARLATGSSRRRAQLLSRRPDLKLTDIRGNVETRLRKLDELGLDGIVLAQAGLERLGLESAITERLDPGWMIPAVGQGALGIECRASDGATQQALHSIHHVATGWAVLAERAFLRGLGGGCMLPIAAHASVTEGVLVLRGAVYSPDGKQALFAQTTAPDLTAESVGRALADQLLTQGAQRLLIPPPL